MSCVLALDVGGTSMKGAVVEGGPAPDIVVERRYPTPAADGPERVLRAIADAAVDLRGAASSRGREAVSVGVVVPGIVDEARGVAVAAANLGWADAPVAGLLGERLGLPVALGHDVRAGGIAENRLGAGRGAGTMLFVALGTGIAAACVVDGVPLVAGGYAGEIGHIRVDPDAEPCGCGGRGCLERVASAAAIARRYEGRSGRTVSGAVEVAELVRGGDPLAREVWDEAVCALVGVLAGCVSLLGPETIVVGGGLAEAGELLMDPLERRLYESLTFQRRPRLVRASLGDQAGCLGAALAAEQAAGDAVGDNAAGGQEGSHDEL